MSAGGLTYSGLTNFGKVTLPSVDTWGTNMNILRDPPKSIVTRKIDKVGGDSDITQMIQDSGDRACEAINVFARGVNPMVSVSYSNYGNNGGQGQAGSLTGLSNSLMGGGGGRNASLPYKAMEGGAFRPPLRTQEDLLPLSRQPRVWTTAFTNCGFTDFSRKLRECPDNGDNMREIQHNISTNVKPTAVYKLEKSAEPTRDLIMDKIQNPVKTSGNSGIRTMDRTQQNVQKPSNNIANPITTNAQSNMATNRVFVGDNNNLNTNKYVQDITTQNVRTNFNSNNNSTTRIDDIILVDHSNLPIHEDYRNISTTARKSGTDQSKYIHEDVSLARVIPNHTATTNSSTNTISKRQEYENYINLSRNIPQGNYNVTQIKQQENLGSRTAHLNPKISAGGMTGRGQMPTQQRGQQIAESYETPSSKLSKLAAENMHGRFIHNAPFA